MKSAFALALTVGAASATNLRASTNEALQSEVVTVLQSAVQGLADKYDCHAASGDLVETVKKIVEENSKEKTRLTGECDDMVSKYSRQRVEAKKTFTTAFDKVVPEETVIEETKVTKANTDFKEKEAEWCVEGFTVTGYSGCATYGTSINPSKTESDNADRAAAAAIAEHDAAQSTYIADKSSSDSNVLKLSTETKEKSAVALKAKNDAYEKARLSKIELIATITKDHENAKANCLRIKNERDAHIAADQKVIDAMKPLLEQLKFCESSKDTIGINSATLFLEVDADMQAKCAAAKKQVSVLLELQGVSPSGQYKDFVSRIDQETTLATESKVTCDTQAKSAFDTNKKAAQDREQTTRDAEDKEYATRIETFETSLKNFKAAEKTRIDAQFLACCDDTLATSKKSVRTKAVSLQETKNEIFSAKKEQGRTEMIAAVTSKLDTIQFAEDHKTTTVASRKLKLTIENNAAVATIDEASENGVKYCTSAQSDLAAESQTLTKLEALFDTGLKTIGNNALGKEAEDKVIQDAADAKAAADKAIADEAAAAKAAAEAARARAAAAAKAKADGAVSAGSIGSKNYNQCRDHCQNIGRQLATQREILSAVSKQNGDVWTPVRGDNDWLQLGNGHWPFGLLHTEIDGARHGKPGWGQQIGSHGFKREFYCSASDITEFSIGSKNYDQCKADCASRGTRLASKTELLKYLDGRKQTGDVWTPVFGANDWLQLGDGHWPYGLLHTEIDGARHGKPRWGYQNQHHGFKRLFYCTK